MRQLTLAKCEAVEMLLNVACHMMHTQTHAAAVTRLIVSIVVVIVIVRFVVVVVRIFVVGACMHSCDCGASCGFVASQSSDMQQNAR